MATREKYVKQNHRQKTVKPTFEAYGVDSTAVEEKTMKYWKKKVNATFETSSIDSTAVEEKLFGLEMETDDSDDKPVVFICGSCRLPVGDSLSWDGGEDRQNQIRLKRVTDNVLVGKDTRLHEASKEVMCLVMDLLCRGCRSPLGMIYSSTPKNLDHKRFTFCFNVANIDSYVLGSAKQLLAAEGNKEQLVTLEYRNSVEQQLMEMKMLVMSMAQRLEEIEADL